MDVGLIQPPRLGLWHLDFDRQAFVEVEPRWFPLWRLSEEQLAGIVTGQSITCSAIEPYRLMLPHQLRRPGRWLAGALYVRVDHGSNPRGLPHLWDARDWPRREAWGGLLNIETSPYPWVRDLARGTTAWFTMNGRDAWAARGITRANDRPIIFEFERVH